MVTKEIHINRDKKDELIVWKWGTLLPYIELFIKYNGYKHEIFYLFFFLNEILQDEIGAKTRVIFSKKVNLQGVFERDWKAFWHHKELRSRCKSYLNSRLCPKINFHGRFKYDFMYPWTDWEFQLAVVLFEEYQNLPALAGNSRTVIIEKGFWWWSNTLEDFSNNFPSEWAYFKDSLFQIPDYIIDWRNNEFTDFFNHFNVSKKDQDKMFPNLRKLRKGNMLKFLNKLDRPIALIT